MTNISDSDKAGATAQPGLPRQLLSIVTLHHKVSSDIDEMTNRCILSVAENTLNEHEHIVVTSTTENRLYIAQAVNLGFQKAHGNIFCLLHNDVIVPPKWDELLVQAASSGYVAFPRIDESESDCESRQVRKSAPWMIPGCCMVLSRAAYETIGGFDERYRGLHWEDTDFYRMAMVCGFKLVRGPVTIKHLRGKTRSEMRLIEGEEFVRNRILYEEKWGDLQIPCFTTA